MPNHMFFGTMTVYQTVGTIYATAWTKISEKSHQMLWLFPQWLWSDTTNRFSARPLHYYILWVQFTLFLLIVSVINCGTTVCSNFPLDCILGKPFGMFSAGNPETWMRFQTVTLMYFSVGNQKIWFWTKYATLNDWKYCLIWQIFVWSKRNDALMA